MLTGDPFTETKLSIEDGSRLMDLLGINALTIKDPTKFRQLREIGSFIKQNNALSLIRNIAQSVPPSDRLEKAMGYVLLRQDEMSLTAKIDALKKEKGDVNKIKELKEKRKGLIRELKYYE